jgi:hypothetical protein
MDLSRRRAEIKLKDRKVPRLTAVQGKVDSAVAT